MELEIRSLWSTDLNPPSEGVPDGLQNYAVYVQLALGERGKEGSEVFGLTVCSDPSMLPRDDGRFITHTLVMHTFSWTALQSRLEKLLLHAGVPRATNWTEVIDRLKPYMHASDNGD